MNDRTPRPIQFDSVADIYDNYVRADFDIPFWLSESQSVSGKVLELTCGTGRVSIHLLKAGINLYCVDYSPQMLEVFRKKIKENNLFCMPICQDIAELRLPDRFDLIFIPFHSFSETLLEQKRRASLEGIRTHLTPRGTFICTLQNLAIRAASMDGSLRLVGEFPMGNGDTLVVRSRLTFDPSTQLATGEQTYDRFAANGALVDQRSLDMSFYLFHQPEFEALVRETGFEIGDLYGNYDRSPYDEQTSPFMIWKLRRSAPDP